MDHASRADASPTGVPGELGGAGGADRIPSSDPGAGIGLPHIRGRSAVAPAPVPSIADPVESEVSEPDAVEGASTGVVPIPDVPRTATSSTSFPPGVAAKLGCYVYLLVDPRSGRPFFVGRGRGDRCHRHVDAARGRASTDDPSSKYPLLDRIREVEAGGRAVQVEILRHGLTPAEADLVESSVADALGLLHATQLDPQRRSAVEVGAALAKRAKFKRDHQVVLLRVDPQGAPTEYPSVRHGWPIGRPWIDTDSRRSPLWAVVVAAGDLVDAVYRIDGWEPSPRPTGAGAGGEHYSFVGTPAPELDARYAGRSVRDYLGTGAPGAVTYVGCGPDWTDTAH
jgi:hypothetical protein